MIACTGMRCGGVAELLQSGQQTGQDRFELIGPSPSHWSLMALSSQQLRSLLMPGSNSVRS